uniref:Headcase N-terminal domain-containing protein n=1 Tax=Ciona savignyi TaxID=51511 RepID=H2YMT3_CIOSA
MAGKRNRRDSENSCGTPCAGKDHSPNRGTCSSSSGSIEDDSENLRKCCFPGVCPFGEDSAADESVMVKVICNSEACPLSQFMHAECFHQWEETILGHLRSHGRARSWSEKQRRQNLWTKRGYDLAYRACACACRHGHLRKDLNWVASTPQQTVDVQDATGRKKNRRKHKDLPTLGGIKYGSLPMKTKSKPIPNKDSRMRHSSASSSVSVDQGYISESPGTGEAPYVFSPPSTRMHFSFHNVGQP